MDDNNNKRGFGIFGVIAAGVAAAAAVAVVVTKKKKAAQKNYFLKDDVVKLPVFKRDEPEKAELKQDEEDDIFEEEDYTVQSDNKSFFNDTEEVSYEEDEEFVPKTHAAPANPVEAPLETPKPEAPAEALKPEAPAEALKPEAPAEALKPEAPAEVPKASARIEFFEEEALAEPVVSESKSDSDDTFVFESVVVGKENKPGESVAAGLHDPAMDELIKAAMEEVTGEPYSSPEFSKTALENDTVKETASTEEAEIPKAEPAAEMPKTEPAAEMPKTEPAAEMPKTEPAAEMPKTEPVAEMPKTEPAAEMPKTEHVEEAPKAEPPVKPAPYHNPVQSSASVVWKDEEENTESDESYDDDEIRSHESYYDWIYNVDEHYSVITDGKWVYCKSDDILTSTSVNKKGGRETIDISETFKNRLKTEGYCLLKYIGNEREVTIPSHINGKPVVAAMNTFRSNQTIKKVIIPSTMLGLRRTFYSCYHLDKIIFEEGTKLVYELDSIMCGNNDMDSNTESTTIVCSPEVAAYLRGHYKLGCPVVFEEKSNTINE